MYYYMYKYTVLYILIVGINIKVVLVARSTAYFFQTDPFQGSRDSQECQKETTADALTLLNVAYSINLIL